MILGILKLRKLVNKFILLIPPLNQIELVCSENSVELRVHDWIDLLIEALFEHLRDEVDHGFKKILIFEDKLSLSMAQKHSHIGIAYFLTFVLQLMGLMEHQSAGFKLILSGMIRIFGFIVF